MFLKNLFNRKPKPKINGHNTIIGNITVDGDITCLAGDSIVVNGTVMGSIRLENGDNSTLIVGNNGRIFRSVERDCEDNELIADHIIIYGTVTAKKIVARYSLSIMSSAHVTSDFILYGSLTVNEGAMITGHMRDEHGG